MFVVLARMQVKVDRIVDFERAAVALWQASHAAEPACLRYEYVRLVEPGRYLAQMVFDDYQGFITHQASDHHRAIAGGEMREMIESIQIEYGQPVAAAFGAPDDSAAFDLVVPAEARRHYRERYPQPDPGWWVPC
jgi:quinol monooxygenase YgiN